MFGFLRKKAAPAELSEVTLTRQRQGVYEVTVHGKISEAQFRALQAEGAHEIETHGAIKLLCDMRDMQGWLTPPKGDNLEFLLKYDVHIKKIAIVAAAEQKAAALMFTGAGYRKAEVRFFATAAMDQARQWISEG
jgi:hypothetical protein